MAQDQPFRYRTILEVGIIALVIYYFLGTPGLSLSSTSTSPTSSSFDRVTERDIPDAKARVESLVYADTNLQCGSHSFTGVHIFSASPLVVYIDAFLSETEADHMVEISSNKWQPSTVFNRGVEESDESVRKSEKAMIERDNIVQCIEARALDFQGWPEKTYIERLWTQRYNTTGHYAHHYDWASASKTSRRTSTFMVYLSSGSEVEGGGTNFPRFTAPSDERWCEFIECPRSRSGEVESRGGGDEGRANGGVEVEGVTFKVRKGAAVFWTNFDAEGRGYKETIHAGMPVRSGTKVG